MYFDGRYVNIPKMADVSIFTKNLPKLILISFILQMTKKTIQNHQSFHLMYTICTSL